MVEEDDEQTTNQQRRSIRFDEEEVSKEKTNFAILPSLEIRLNLQSCLG